MCDSRRSFPKVKQEYMPCRRSLPLLPVGLLLFAAALCAEQAKPVAFISAFKGNYAEGAAVLNTVLKPGGVDVVHFRDWLPIGEYESHSAIVFAGAVPEAPEFQEKMKTREYYDLYLKTIRGEEIKIPDKPSDTLPGGDKGAGEEGAGKGELLIEEGVGGDDPFERPKPHIWTTWVDDLGRDALEDYLNSGGVIVLLQSTVAALSKNDPSALAGLLGFKRLGRAPKAAHRIRVADGASPITKSLEKGLYDWGAGSAQTVGDLCGAKVLAEVVAADGKPIGPFATVNVVGKGKVYWFGGSPLGLLRAAAKKAPPIIDDSLRAYFDLIAGAVLQARPARTRIAREPWDNTPLGPPGKLDYSQADSWQVPEVPPLPPFAEMARKLSEREPQPSVLLAEKGEPRAVIVLPADADAATQSSGEVLVGHLNRMLVKPDPSFNIQSLWAQFSTATKKEAQAEAQSDLLEMTEINARESDDGDESLDDETEEDDGDKGQPEKQATFPRIRFSELGEGTRGSERGIRPTSEKWKQWNVILLGRFPVLKDLGIDLDALVPEGILLRTLGNTVIITGEGHVGIQHAVHTFLESLGCRYLWPGELGKVVPYREALHAPELNRRESPQMCMRNLRSISASSDRSQGGLVRLGVSTKHYGEMIRAGSMTLQKGRGWPGWHRLGIRELVYRGHSFTGYWEGHGKEHPEWFALQPTGIRDQSVSSSRPRFCHSNRQLIDQVIKDKCAELEAEPGQAGVALGLPDGGQTSFCLCGNCRKLDPVDAQERQFLDCSVGVQWRFSYRSLTDRVLWFSNEIAKGVAARFPDKYLSYDVYSAYSAPPVAVRPHPNLLIACVPGSSMYRSEESRERQFRFLAKWASFGNRMFLRPNILLANWSTVVPQNFARKLFYDFRFFHNRRMIGSDFDSILGHWSTMGPTYYVLAKAHWDPGKVTAEELIADYCLKGFDKAAEPIYNYFGEVEALTADAASKGTSIIESYTPERLKRLRSYLEKAKGIASKLPDPNVLHRVKFLEIGLEIAELTKAVADGGGRPERDQLRARAVQALEEYPTAIGTPYFGLMNYGWYR